MSNPTAAVDHSQVAAKHRAMWASGDYAKLAAELVAPARPRAGGSHRHRAGRPSAGRGRRHRKRGDPRRRDRSKRRRQRPVPGVVGAGQQAGRRARRRTRMARGQRPRIAFRGRRIRCGDVVYRRDVRAVPSARRRRAGPGVQTGRPDRADQLDARGPHRAAVGRDEAVRSRAPARRAATSAVGQEEHVRALLGDRVTDVVTERRMLAVDHFADGAEFRDYFKNLYGPTIAVYRNIEGDPDRVAALDADIARVGDSVLSDSRRWNGSTCC